MHYSQPIWSATPSNNHQSCHLIFDFFEIAIFVSVGQSFLREIQTTNGFLCECCTAGCFPNPVCAQLEVTKCAFAATLQLHTLLRAYVLIRQRSRDSQANFVAFTKQKNYFYI